MELDPDLVGSILSSPIPPADKVAALVSVVANDAISTEDGWRLYRRWADDISGRRLALGLTELLQQRPVAPAALPSPPGRGRAQESEDAALARQIEQEQRDAALARQLGREQGLAAEAQDAALARQLGRERADQEAEDAAIARQLHAIDLDAEAELGRRRAAEQARAAEVERQQAVAGARAVALARCDSGETAMQLRAAEQDAQLMASLLPSPFEDPDFAPSAFGRVSGWLRPSQVQYNCGQPVTSRWELFRGQPEPTDVVQGELGDCWFLSSLACLCAFNNGQLVRQLFPGQNRLSPNGAYVVRLCIAGYWQLLAIDDRLPSIGGQGFATQLACCQTDRMQLWASLVEKAFAKICGGYPQLVAGQCQEALALITGWPTHRISLDKPDLDPDSLFARIHSGIEAGYIVCCSTRAADASYSSVGLVAHHAYSVVEAIRLSELVGRKLLLLKIRNPHGRNEWSGAWSDHSPNWTPALRQACRMHGGEDGVFCMELSDMIRMFESVTICEFRQGWHEQRVPSQLPGQGLRLDRGLKVSGSGMATVSMHQASMRGRWEPDRLADMAVAVCRKGRAGRWELVESSPACIAEQVHLDVCLDADTEYLAFPVSFSSKFEPTAINIVVVSARKTHCQPVSVSASEAGTLVQQYVTASKASEVQMFHGVAISTRKDGCGLFVHVANRTHAQWAVLEYHILHCENMDLLRGSALTRDEIPPNHTQLAVAAVATASSYSYNSQQQIQLCNNSAGIGHQPPLPLNSMHEVRFFN